MPSGRVGLRWLTQTTQTCEAVLLERNGRQMRLETTLPLPCGAAAEIQLDEGLAFGEVTRSQPREGGFEIWVLADQMLAKPRKMAWRNAAPESTMDDLLRLSAGLEHAVATHLERCGL